MKGRPLVGPASMRCEAGRRSPGAWTVAPSRSVVPRGVRTAVKRWLGPVTRLAWPLARLWAGPAYFAKTPPFDPPRSLAIIACHWIGDTLWAAQVIPALRSAWPNAAITVITKPHAVDLWRGFVPAECVVSAPEITSDRHRERATWTGLFRRAASLRDRRFDLVIDLTGNRYSALFTFLLRPRWSLGFAGDEVGWLYSAGGRVLPAVTHLREQPFGVLERILPGIGLPADVRPPDPSLSFPAACRACGLDSEEPVIVLAPGAGWPEKRWPEELFVEIAGAVLSAGAQTVVVGSSSEAELCERVRSGGARVLARTRGTGNPPGRDGTSGDHGRATVLVGSLLGEVCGLLSGATAVIGHDSGVVHLAAAYGRRTVALLVAASDPGFCAPIGASSRVLRPGEAGSDSRSIASWALAESGGGDG